MAFVNYIEINYHTRIVPQYTSLNTGEVANSDCNNFFIFQQKRRVYV